MKLKNLTDGKLSLHDPKTRLSSGLEFETVNRPNVGYFRILLPWYRQYLAGGRLGDFVTLEPGQSTEELAPPCIPLVAGKYAIHVCYNNLRRGPDPSISFLGTVWADDNTFVVPDEISPARKAAYAKARQLILSPETKPADAAKAMDAIAAERHVFAARFIAEIWSNIKDQKLKQAAFDDWMKLLRLGTAYDSMPQAMGLLESALTSDETRAAILDALSEVDCGNIGGKAYCMVLVDGKGDTQGEYVPPQALTDRFDKVVRELSKSDVPVLVEKAGRLAAKFDRPPPVRLRFSTTRNAK